MGRGRGNEEVLTERIRRRLTGADETKAQRIERCRGNIAAFARTYLPHYCDRPFGRHHRAKYRICQEEWAGLRLADVEPRDHGKTTSNCPVLLLYAHCYGLSRHTVIVGYSEPDANDLLEGVKHEMLDNELLVEDFGPFLDPSAPRYETNRVWQQRQVILLDGSRIRALGRKQQIRGRKHRQDRIDLLLMDDLQKPDDCSERDQRDKMADWVLGDAVPALKADGAAILSHNIVHHDCVAARLAKKGSGWRVLKTRAILHWARRQDLWDEYLAIIGDGKKRAHVRRAHDFYKANQAAMDDGARVLWPQARSYEMLMGILARIGRRKFEIEYQNNARDEDLYPWAREKLKTFDRNTVKDAPFRAVMVADPAKQKGFGKSKQAWAVVGQHPNGAIYVIDAWKGKLPDTRIVDEWFDAFLTWNAWVATGVREFHLESTGALLLGPILHRLSLEKGVNLPLKELPAKGEKTDRDSAAIDPLVTYGALYVEESLTWLLDDLADFPDGDLDAIDCLAHAVNLLRLPRTVEGWGSGRKRVMAGATRW